MDQAIVQLLDRIEERLAALDISDRKASIKAVGKPDAIRDIRRGRMPGADRLSSLAEALQTSVEFLLGKSDISEATRMGQARRVVPHITDMPKDIPVYGTAIGADTEFMTEINEAVAIEQIDLDQSDVIDRFRRPPGLVDRRDVYGLYVAGHSMEPAFDSGRGILIDPKRPPAIRDFVVVYIARPGTHDDLDGVKCVLLKRLIRRSATYVELEQYNPNVTFKVPVKIIQSMQRVMPWDEAFGM